MHRSAVAVTLVLLLASSIPLAPPAAADAATRLAHQFPSSMSNAAAVWLGGKVYSFGGHHVDPYPSTPVVEYDPGTGSITTFPAVPYGTGEASGVTDGAYAYFFGGDYSPDKVFRFDPQTGAFAQAGTLFPGRLGTSAVWTGQHAYIFGGCLGGTCSATRVLDDILRYDAASQTVTYMAATLPTGRFDTAAVWDGTYAYVFGGSSSCGDTGCIRLDQIVRYDPAADSVTVLPAVLPARLDDMSAVWAGEAAYVFGGRANTGVDTADIVRFRPNPLAVDLMSARLPSARAATAAVWTGEKAFVLGGDTVSSNRDIVQYTTAPGAPANLQASRGDAVGEIDLSWQAPAGNTYSSPINGYRMYRDGNPVATLGAVLSHTDTGLAQGSTHTYRVAAINPRGEGAASNNATASAPTVPGPPTGLTATRGTGVGQIQLTWQAPASNGGLALAGYDIHRGTSPGGETFLASVGLVLSYTDTGLPNGATRYYKVAARNAAGAGALSNEASATAPDVPGASRNLAASRGPGPGQITLAWQAPSDNGGLALTGYDIHRGTSPGSETFLASVGLVLSYADTGLPSGATRYYKVAARNAAGVGALGNEASATSPVAPSAPLAPSAAPGPGAGQIQVTWSAPSDNGGTAITGYRVYRGAEPGTAVFLTQVGPVLAFTDAGLPAGAVRYYQVSAVNPLGEGPRSPEVSGRAPTPPGPPQGLTAQPALALGLGGPGVVTGGVRLQWQAPADTGGVAITNYRVSWGTNPSSLAQVTTTGNVLTYTHSGASMTAPNYYQLVAVNGAGLAGAPSAVACGLTYPWGPGLPPPGGACA